MLAARHDRGDRALDRPRGELSEPVRERPEILLPRAGGFDDRRPPPMGPQGLRADRDESATTGRPSADPPPLAPVSYTHLTLPTIYSV